MTPSSHQNGHTSPARSLCARAHRVGLESQKARSETARFAYVGNQYCRRPDFADADGHQRPGARHSAATSPTISQTGAGHVAREYTSSSSRAAVRARRTPPVWCSSNRRLRNCNAGHDIIIFPFPSVTSAIGHRRRRQPKSGLRHRHHGHRRSPIVDKRDTRGSTARPPHHPRCARAAAQ